MDDNINKELETEDSTFSTFKWKKSKKISKISISKFNRRKKIDNYFNWCLVVGFGLLIFTKIIASIIYDATTKDYIGNGLLHSPFISSIFIHFTWWTTIIVFISQLLILINKHKKIKSKFLNKWTNKHILLAVAVYDSIVCLFVVVAAVASLLKIGPESLQAFDGNDADGVPVPPSPQIFGILSILVHFIFPPLLVIYSVFHFKFYKKTTTSKWFLIYILSLPCFYMIFYIIFANLEWGWDPYPVSNLKMGEGYWYFPIGLIGIELIAIALFYLFKLEKPYEIIIEGSINKK